MSPSRYAGAALVVLLALGACAPVEPMRPPEPRRGKIDYEQDLPPVEKARVEIIDLQEIPEPETGRVRINGTLINFGKAPTTQVSVRVRAVDASNHVVNMISGVPSTQNIPPGGSATFTAWFEDRPEVKRYHVEAVVR